MPLKTCRNSLNTTRVQTLWSSRSRTNSTWSLTFSRLAWSRSYLETTLFRLRRFRSFLKIKTRNLNLDIIIMEVNNQKNYKGHKNEDMRLSELTWSQNLTINSELSWESEKEQWFLLKSNRVILRSPSQGLNCVKSLLCLIENTIPNRTPRPNRAMILQTEAVRVFSSNKTVSHKVKEILNPRNPTIKFILRLLRLELQECFQLPKT
jgi:hypothetical protein